MLKNCKIKNPNLNSRSQDSDMHKKKNPTLWAGFILKLSKSKYSRKLYFLSRIIDYELLSSINIIINIPSINGIIYIPDTMFQIREIVDVNAAEII